MKPQDLTLHCDHQNGCGVSLFAISVTVEGRKHKTVMSINHVSHVHKPCHRETGAETGSNPERWVFDISLRRLVQVPLDQSTSLAYNRMTPSAQDTVTATQVQQPFRKDSTYVEQWKFHFSGFSYYVCTDIMANEEIHCRTVFLW